MQFLFHTCHPFCYSYYKPGDKTWMRKGPDCDYDKRNISVACEYKRRYLIPCARRVSRIIFIGYAQSQNTDTNLFHNPSPLYSLLYNGNKDINIPGVDRDFSHEIPQQFSRLPLLGAIFLSEPPLTWNPGPAPAYNIKRTCSCEFCLYSLLNIHFSVYFHTT